MAPWSWRWSCGWLFWVPVIPWQQKLELQVHLDLVFFIFGCREYFVALNIIKIYHLLCKKRHLLNSSHRDIVTNFQSILMVKISNFYHPPMKLHQRYVFSLDVTITRDVFNLTIEEPPPQDMGPHCSWTPTPVPVPMRPHCTGTPAPTSDILWPRFETHSNWGHPPMPVTSGG